MKNKKYTKGIKLYKTAAILYTLLTIFLTTMFIYIIFFSNVGKEDNYNAEVLLFIIKYIILIGIPGNAIITIIDLIAMILIKINKDSENIKDRKSFLKSLILLLLPTLTIGIFYVLCFLLTT